MKKTACLILLIAACGDSENSPSTLIEVAQSSLSYTQSARFSGDLMVVDGAIFSLDGTASESMGTVTDGLNAGIYQNETWVCGGNVDGFFVAKRDGVSWAEPTTFPMPKELDTATFFTTFNCAVTSAGFMFEISEGTDDAPMLSDYTLASLDGELQLMDGFATWSELGWNDTLARVARFQDGRSYSVGYQQAGQQPTLIDLETGSLAASSEHSVIANGIVAQNATALMMDDWNIAETIDLGEELIVVDVDMLSGRPVVLGVDNAGQLKLKYEATSVDLPGFISALHVVDGFVYVALQDTNELQVFQLR
ncbi:MAG: hypothetical protein R3E66_00080 [bacterium]